MTQSKTTGAMIMALLMWLMLSSTAHARGGLPDFTELVAENGEAVVNISTKSKPSEAMASSPFPPGMEMPEGTPI